MGKDNDEDEDEDILETVTLYSFQTDGDQNKPELPPSEDETLEKTMIMPLPDGDRGPAPPQDTVLNPRSNSTHDKLADQGFDDLEETLILTPGKRQQEKKQ